LSAAQLRRHPQGFGRALSAVEFHLAQVKEIVVVGPQRNELERSVRARYYPNAVIVNSADPARDAGHIPFLKDKVVIEGKATAYVCEGFVCQRPVTTVDELLKHL
jgi:uncharacterized protein YyaL (SSP411 family)